LEDSFGYYNGTSAAVSAHLITDYGTLTIEDSVGGGKIHDDYTYKITNWSTDYFAILVPGAIKGSSTEAPATRNKLTINSGKIVGPTMYGIYSGVDHQGRDFILNGGLIYGGRYGVREFNHLEGNTTVFEMNGGQIHTYQWLYF
jgi:hypothetical protein